jgi:hypothetical protein
MELDIEKNKIERLGANPVRLEFTAQYTAIFYPSIVRLENVKSGKTNGQEHSTCLNARYSRSNLHCLNEAFNPW